MKLKLKHQDQFRFTEKGHLHEMKIGDIWTPVPGCSTIAGLFDDKGWFGYWASGQALKPLGWMKLEKDGSNKEKVLKAAHIGLAMIQHYVLGGDELLPKFDISGYSKFLDKCYRAHAKETKDTAEAGTWIHEWFEEYIKAKIKNGIFNKEFIPEDHIYKKQLDKFFAWEKENSVEWLASEVQVGSLMFQYCGILDFIAKINGRIVLGDFKTSSMFKDTYIPQLVGLKQAIEEMGQPIDDLMVVRLSRDGDFEVHPVEVDFDRELHAFIRAKDFLQARNLFKARRKEIFPEPNLKEWRG